jgi:hypothetical protein
MPVISNLDFNSLTTKINEYSRLEQAGAVIAGVFAVYVLHSVFPGINDVADMGVGSCCMRLR